MVRALAARNGRPSQLVPKPKPVPSNEKITAYFAIRKRAHDSKSDVDVLGKRLKNDVSFTEEEELYETPKEFSDNVLGRTLSFSDEKKENVSPPSTPLRGYDFRPVKSYLGQRLFDGSMPFSSMTPFGVFDELPRPGLHDFINLLPLESCCRLAMTSSHFAEEFVKYLKTSDATRRFMRLAEETNGDRPPRVFGFFGAFIKAATNLKDMTERVKFAVEFYARLKVFVPNEAGWGCFFQALADMWKFNEVVSLVYAVLAAEQYRLGNLVDEVVEAEPGENKANELAVRDELHALFLNERANEGMWIAAMLKTRLHAAEQGRLLMLLHAPTEVDDDGVKGIAWRSLCDTQVTSMADGEERLGPLAEALANLKPKIGVIKVPYAWTNTDLFNLIEEVTTFPEPWSFDNFVTLLLQVPTVLVPTSIVARMTHNFEEEAGQMFITMKTLLYRWNIDLATVEPAIMEIFRQLRSFDRDYTDDFVSSVMNAHFTAIEELVALTPNRNRVGFANNTAVLDENRSFKTVWGMMEKARAANNRK